MAIVRWEPLRELNVLQTEMNRLFGGFFDQQAGQAAGGGDQLPRRHWIPAMDLVETDGAFILRADLPGLRRDDVKIELEENVLTISGERSAHHDERVAQGYHRIERATGAFARSLTLPPGVDADRIEATFEHGVLEVRIPTPEQPRPRRVTINATGGQEAATVEGTEASAPAQGHSEEHPAPELAGASV
jgi:HSP20 family protein